METLKQHRSCLASTLPGKWIQEEEMSRLSGSGRRFYQLIDFPRINPESNRQVFFNLTMHRVTNTPILFSLHPGVIYTDLYSNVPGIKFVSAIAR